MKTAVAKSPKNRSLDGFRNARSQARKFHARTIGPDVDPKHCLGDYLVCLLDNDRTRLDKEYHVKTAMSESYGGLTGGYIVPEELRYGIMDDVAEEAIFRPRATVIPMTTDILRLPLPDAGTAPSAAGISPFFGGINPKWTQEAISRPETEPAFRQVEMQAHDLTGYALISNTMANDGGAPLEMWLRRLFSRSIAWAEDYAFFQGNGVTKPVGVINASGTLGQARGTTNKVSIGDLANVANNLLPSSYNRALWGIAVTAIAQVGAITAAGGLLAFLPGDDGSAGILLGRPFFVTEKVPALGTTGDVTLFDPALYVIGDRQEMTIDVSADEPTAYKNNQSVWRFIHRVDGQPWFSKTITLQDASTVVSPYVVLNH